MKIRALSGTGGVPGSALKWTIMLRRSVTMQMAVFPSDSGSFMISTWTTSARDGLEQVRVGANQN